MTPAIWLVAIICVITLAFLFGRRFVRRLRAAPPSGYVASDIAGFAEIALPQNWHAVGHLKRNANLQARHATGNRFMITISECRGDFVADVTRDLHSAMTRSKLESNVRVVDTRGPTHRSVGGYEAVQFEIDALIKRSRITYLHTTIAGTRAFHQILCWATRSAYDRAEFDRLLNGFRERPGPPAPVALPIDERKPAATRAIGFGQWRT